MNFDPLNKAACLVNLVDGGDAGNQPDARCNDAAFASAHPDICGSQSYLIIKPSSALIMRLSGVSYTVFEYANGIESQVIDGLHFTSSNPDIFLIGASTGSGTGLAKGSSIITVTRNGLSASATVTVLDSTVGCSETAVKSFILVDNSRSTSLSFGGVWNTRLDFAKAAAQRWADKLIVVDGAAKDGFKVSSFSDSIVDVTGDYIGDQTILDADINAIQQTLDKTDIFDPLSAAILDLTLAVADEKVLILISDGEQTTSTNFQPILDSAASFKAAGGVIIAIGLRASGLGFDLLERIATGGFFLNGTTATAQAVLDGLAFLKSAVCAGECVAAGDVYENRAQLDYSSFKNWEVIKGQVDLIGNGEYDYLPGNGLYVDMIGSHGYTRDNTIRSIDRFALVAGSDYTIAFDVAGNNRQDVGPQSIKVYLRDPDAPATDPNIFEHLVSPEWDAEFQIYSFTFNSPKTLSAKIYFQQVLADATLDSPFGNILDDVVFSDANLNVLLSDNFDSENSTYIPPACGTGKTYVPYSGGAGGYAPLIPPMASPSNAFGTASSNSDDGVNHAYGAFSGVQYDGSSAGSFWQSAVPNSDQSIQFQFSTAQIVSKYSFAGSSARDASPTSWTLQGSNDGSSWTVLDTVVHHTWTNSNPHYVSDNHNVDVFTIPNAAPYVFYKIVVTDAVNKAALIFLSAGYQIWQLQMYASIPGTSYSYISSYYGCYGDQCSQSASEAAQYQDPNPLPDIESGVQPQKFTSTQNACATCLDGNVNTSPVSAVPLMTTDSTPSGLASANSEFGFPNSDAHNAFDGDDSTAWFAFNGNPPEFLQYKFAAAMAASAYSVKVLQQQIPVFVPAPVTYPLGFDFQASNDGSNWVTLDSQASLIWSPGEEKRFPVSNSSSYLYYRLNYSGSEQSGLGEICKFGIYGSAPSQICKQGTATSYISQADADSKALAAATNAANSALNCVHIYTSTQSYTAVCPLENGTPVTQTANASSFVSQADADASATAVAKAAAIAALVCTNSNNTQQITINDNAAASPYPSVKVVSGLVGHITKVTVAINGLRHSYPNDISMLLVSPSGTKVNIIRSCGGQVLVTGINLVLDDSAGSSLSNTTMANGTFKPTQFGLFNAFPAPCPTGTPLLTLAAFIGEVGNGAWALYVQDTKSQDTGLIAAGFDLTIASA